MQPFLKLALVVLLGFWLGASAYFSFVSAPAVFQLAKAGVITREQAGDVAAAMLKKYFVWAAAVLTLALVCSVLLAFGTGRPKFQRCAIVLAVALALAAIDWLVVTPKVRQLRAQRRAAPSAELDKAFGKAHGISFGLNALTILGTAWAFLIAARPE